MRNFIDKLRRYFKFTRAEMVKFVITMAVFAFVVSFREWGVEDFNLKFGLFNLGNAFVIIFLSIIVHETAHRLFALHKGYRAEHNQWTIGLFITLFLAFITNGWLPFLAYGGIRIHHLAVQRLGKFRYGLNLYDHALISLAGPAANLALAMLFKLLMPLNPILLEKAMVINIMFALFNLIPFPPLDGSDIFYASRLLYAFSVGFFVGISAMLFFLVGIKWAILVGVILGVSFWVILATKVDKEF